MSSKSGDCCHPLAANGDAAQFLHRPVNDVNSKVRVIGLKHLTLNSKAG